MWRITSWSSPKASFVEYDCSKLAAMRASAPSLSPTFTALGTNCEVEYVRRMEIVSRFQSIVGELGRS